MDNLRKCYGKYHGDELESLKCASPAMLGITENGGKTKNYTIGKNNLAKRIMRVTNRDTLTESVKV